MQEIAQGLGSLVPLIEKGGITLMLIAACWYFWKRGEKLATELAKLYRERDAYRTAFALAKGKIELLKLRLGHSVDLDIEEPKLDDRDAA